MDISIPYSSDVILPKPQVAPLENSLDIIIETFFLFFHQITDRYHYTNRLSPALHLLRRSNCQKEYQSDRSLSIGTYFEKFWLALYLLGKGDPSRDHGVVVTDNRKNAFCVFPAPTLTDRSCFCVFRVPWNWTKLEFINVYRETAVPDRFFSLS